MSLVKSSVCEIIENPASFEGKKVVVSGFYKPHYNNIYDEDCWGSSLAFFIPNLPEIGRAKFARHIDKIAEADRPLYSEDAAVVADFVGIIVPTDNALEMPASRQIKVIEYRNIGIARIPQAALIPTRSEYWKEQWNF